MISVIIPVYNAEKYLPQCLDSLLKQTYTDFEAVCVDDGSTDGSLEILQEYAAKDARIKVFPRPNRGCSAARNLGLDKVCGEYVTFLDADDLLHSQFLEIMLKEIKDADVSVCGYTDIDDSTEIKCEPVAAYTVARTTAPEYFGSVGDMQLTVWGKLYRRRALADFRFDEHCHISTDVMYHNGVFSQPLQLNVITAKLVFWRYNPDSMVHKKSSLRKVMSYLLVAEKISERFKNSPLRKNVYKSRVLKAVSNALKYSVACEDKDGLKEQFYPEVRRLYKVGVVRFAGLSLSKKIRLARIVFSGY